MTPWPSLCKGTAMMASPAVAGSIIYDWRFETQHFPIRDQVAGRKRCIQAGPRAQISHDEMRRLAVSNRMSATGRPFNGTLYLDSATLPPCHPPWALAWLCPGDRRFGGSQRETKQRRENVRGWAQLMTGRRVPRIATATMQGGFAGRRGRRPGGGGGGRRGRQ